MINISTEIISSLESSVSSSIQELWQIFAIIFGVILAFYGMRKILFMIKMAK